MAANILLVDNDLVTLKRLKTELEECGYLVDYSTSGKEVFKNLVNNRPDAIMLGLELSELSGWQVCNLLKNNPATQNIPIIIVSDEDNMQTRLTAIEKGANGFIKKPYLLAELINQLKRYTH
ncbi:MAG: response regulator [Candidatus Schekmanbacteria bacterium]|nr:response regulator [Candidatus Schekmanbacteria bacterium]